MLPESNIARNNSATSNNDDNSTNAESKPSAHPKGNVASNATNDGQGSISLLTSSNEETVFQDIRYQINIVEFPTLDDVGPVIEAYEKKLGNWLSIQHRLIGEFHLFVCKEHVNCTCQIYIGRRQLDGAYVVKLNISYHTVEQCEPCACAGCQWKKHRAGKLDNMIVQAVRTEKDRPTPANFIKTAASRDGEVITYMPAYRSLNNQSCAQLRHSSKKFELRPGYHKARKQLNPDAVIGYSHDSEKSIKHVYVFPCFMNAALKFLRPVISLDAAHLKSIYKGTMYVASVLSRANEVYPIGFMISNGSEDGKTWTTMLNCLI